MTLLYEVGNRCVRIGNDIQRCLDEILETAITFTGADKGNLQLLDQKNGTLTIAAHRGFSQPFLSYFNAVRTEVAAACAAAMQSGERVIIEDVTKSPIFAGPVYGEIHHRPPSEFRSGPKVCLRALHSAVEAAGSGVVYLQV